MASERIKSKLRGMVDVDFHPTQATVDEVAEVIQAACDLQSALYSSSLHREQLFALRKSLEGLFGHELPIGG